MDTLVETMTETQAQILDELNDGYVPRTSPMTVEELMQASADRKAGRAKVVSLEEAKAIADAFCG